MNTIQTTLSAEQDKIERIDDIPLLVALQQRVGIAEIIDEVIPSHWLHQGLSLGQLVVGWTTFILSEGNRRKVSVEDWAKAHPMILSVKSSASPTSPMSDLDKCLPTSAMTKTLGGLKISCGKSKCVSIKSHRSESAWMPPNSVGIIR